jgi:hypothetical protein
VPAGSGQSGGPAGWTAGPAGLQFERRLTVSFQRYRLIDAAGLAEAPGSLGALEPRAAADPLFLVALHPGEALWIGLTCADGGPCPRLRALGWHRRRAFDLRTGRPAAEAGELAMAGGEGLAIAGLRRAEAAVLPFAPTGPEAADACSRLAFRAARGESGGGAWARVHLVTPASFEARTGCPAPPPADPAAGYGGWRLP